MQVIARSALLLIPTTKKAVCRQIRSQPFCFIKEHYLCNYGVTVEHITSNVLYLLSDQIMKGVMRWARGTHEG